MVSRIAVVSVVAVVVDIYDSRVPTPITAIVVNVDVVTAKVARKERVRVPRRNDDGDIVEWREAIVGIPEVAVIPIIIVVAITVSPTVTEKVVVVS